MNPLLFTDPSFLFCFAPAVLTFYFVLPSRWRNAFLLLASLFLYAWGEGSNIAILLASAAITYACGIRIARTASGKTLAIGVAANLSLLAAFKYSAFAVANVNLGLELAGGSPLPVPALALPVGLSFFTFMAISYLVDVYRKDIEPEPSAATFGLYLTLFPHLIAGPIVRYHHLAGQLHHRVVSLPQVAQGIRRFVIGLGKKVLIGNTVAVSADAIFALPPEQLSAPLAWLGAACYTVQIYFDFSGYSDMAIGLADMLGFRFPENFNYPYIAESVTDFWRRWHMSLSQWLRDYVFFPLGVRGGRWMLYRNTMLVFFLCGLWHGAAWNFVLWGLFHGALLVLERAVGMERLTRIPRLARHGYTLIAVILGWVLFRAEGLSRTAHYIASLSGWGPASSAYDIRQYLQPDVALAMLAGIAGCMPLRRWVPEVQRPLIEFSALAAVFLLAVALTAAGTYTPFIYFRF